MIEAIVSGISAKIYEAFGDNYEIYSDRVSQNLVEPCFLISPMTHHQRTRLSNSTYSRYYREYPFCVFFFPERNGKQYSENQRVAEKLYECLEYIETDIGLIRGANMRYSIEDKDLLNFIVNYKLFVVKNINNELPKIESVEYNTKLEERATNG